METSGGIFIIDEMRKHPRGTTKNKDFASAKSFFFVFYIRILHFSTNFPAISLSSLSSAVVKLAPG